MPLSVNSGSLASNIGKAMLQVSIGEDSAGDRVNELIGSLHIQIAELVKIFSATQKANREFRGDFDEVKAELDGMAKSLKGLARPHESLAVDFRKVRNDVSAILRLASRLDTAIYTVEGNSKRISAFTDQSIDTLQTVTEQMVITAGTVHQEIQSAHRALDDKFADAFNDLDESFARQYEQAVERQNDLLMTIGYVQRENERLNSELLYVRKLVERDLIDHLGIACWRIWIAVSAPLRGWFS